MFIQAYDYVTQYERYLKTERYISVQVVLLLILILVYQDFNFEDVLKYRSRDVS